MRTQESVSPAERERFTRMIESAEHDAMRQAVRSREGGAWKLADDYEALAADWRTIAKLIRGATGAAERADDCPASPGEPCEWSWLAGGEGEADLRCICCGREAIVCLAGDSNGETNGD